MGTCHSCCAIKNKVLPTTPKTSGPRTVTDNFVRGRADGESDVSDTEKVVKKSGGVVIYPGPLSRHVLGSSFSSTCSSRTISELCDDKDDCEVEVGDLRSHGEIDPLAHFYQLTGSSQLNHEALSRYDMLSEVASEVKTEGGLTDVAIDIDHPFAPSYQGGVFIESMLSRPRSVGMRGRSSYAREMMSQLSNYSEFESPRDPGLQREDTPIPGNRGGSRNSHQQGKLLKRKSTKKKGSRVKRTSFPQYEESPRRVPSGMSDGTLSVVSDDGGSSLSSTASLSAIGELSEQSSAASRRSQGACQSNVPHKKQPVKKDKNTHFKTPKSAENLASPKIIELPPIQRRSADLLSGKRQKKVSLDETSYSSKPLSSAWGDQRLYGDGGSALVAKGNRYSNNLSSQSLKLPIHQSVPYNRDVYSPVSPRDSLKLTSPSPRDSDRPMAATRLRRPASGQTHPTPAPRPSVSKRLASLVREELYPDDRTAETYPDLPGTMGEDRFQTIIII